MFDTFSHYLSYGSTDQATVRELSDCFDGLLVPGTIAAFQAEGTKGFVLSLSARSSDPYVIDSRFPLFQNLLAKPKKSHTMLARLLGAPELVERAERLTPEAFTSSLVERVTSGWLDFNVNYESVTSKTFDKYAKRLGQAVLPESRQTPKYILPPYVMVEDRNDGWKEVSDSLWESSTSKAVDLGVRGKLRRVIAASTPYLWDEIAATSEEQEIVAWVSNLDEFRPSSEGPLYEYGSSIRSASARGQSVFALYGGFFSVLLERYGLTGSSHGIGFGEHRDWVELPTSGAPPARYYVPQLHRYIGVDVATILGEIHPGLILCDCATCEMRSPGMLEYHDLMKHSVRVRSAEVDLWRDLTTPDVIERLNRTSDSFNTAIDGLSGLGNVAKRAKDSITHLAMWARVLEKLG